jgi:hypothetical protein
MPSTIYKINSLDYYYTSQTWDAVDKKVDCKQVNYRLLLHVISKLCHAHGIQVLVLLKEDDSLERERHTHRISYVLNSLCCQLSI